MSFHADSFYQGVKWADERYYKKGKAMSDLEVKCPKKGCKGYAHASVSYDEGNTEGPCDECGAQVAFHYTIELDDVRVVKR